MDKKARARLEAAGFDVFDDACDALGLTDAEKAIVDARQAAKAELERLRAEGKISQAELARRMGTKQPAVSRLFKSPAGHRSKRCCAPSPRSAPTRREKSPPR